MTVKICPASEAPVFPKWRKRKENLKHGDLVILVEDTVDRHHWKLGRVTATPQSDLHVWKVEVRRGDGRIVLRDRVKIVKLEMDE